MNKIAVVITDGDPEECTATAVILMDKKDYPIYEATARKCYVESTADYPNLLDEVVEELNKTGMMFEVLKDIKEEWGYYHYEDVEK